MEAYLEAGATSEPSFSPIDWTCVDAAHSVEDRPDVLRLKTHNQPNILAWQTGQKASSPTAVDSINPRMSNLIMVDELLGNKRESKTFNSTSLEPSTTQLFLMYEYDLNEEITKKRRKPRNKSYERLQAGRKAEAREQLMSEADGEINKSLLPEGHYLETTWIMPELECHQCVDIEADLIDFSDLTKTEVVMESELKEVPCKERNKKKVGKAQWNKCYQRRLAKRKAERDDQAQLSEAAEECKSFLAEYVATKMEDNRTPSIGLDEISLLQNVNVTHRNVTVTAEICDLIDLITCEAQPEVRARNSSLTLMISNDPATNADTQNKCLYFDNPGLNMDNSGDAAHLIKL